MFAEKGDTWSYTATSLDDMKNPYAVTPPHSSSFAKLGATSLICFISCATSFAQLANDARENMKQQISSLLQEKASLTPAQRKMSSHLIDAAREKSTGFVRRDMPMLKASIRPQLDGRVEVDIDGAVSDEVLGAIKAAGGEIVVSVPEERAIRAKIPVENIESLAARPDIKFIRPAGRCTTNTGSVNSEGDIAHRSPLARARGATGAGVKIGLLSDSVEDGKGAFFRSKSTGNVPANLTIMPGQAGTGAGEGLAMLEIVHDLAPAAPLYFATGFSGPAPMAQNIRNLANAGCRVIIDDVGYFVDDPPFQDGVISRAINDVSAKGVLYFSSAGNAGNKNDGTSSTWEGDFADGGDASGMPGQQFGSRFHYFGPGSSIPNTNKIIEEGKHTQLFWSDPLGGSSNDYELFIGDANGNVLQQSVNPQDGTQDPVEDVKPPKVGEFVIVVKYSGFPRFLHLDTYRGQLEVNTAGSTRGHNAASAPHAFSVAETTAENRTVAFVGGAANPVLTESSDGPRRMFFNVNGVAYTPGNLSATGGIVLAKPDLTAAAGVKTSMPADSGFNPFFGTSAAAPHVGAIAAQILSFKPNLTPLRVRAALQGSCLNIEAPGYDRDSGHGIVMADRALAFAGAKGDFDFNGQSDLIFQNLSTGERVVWLMRGYARGSTLNLGTTFRSQSIVGVADFNRDGNSDILWQNSTGARFIWLMNGKTRLSTVNIGNLSTAWTFAGAADLNGDARPDILLQHTSGAKGVYLMNGTTFVRSVSLSFGAASQKIAGAGDFNGDGKTDIVWQTSSGSRGVWLLNGTTLINSAALAGTVPASYKIAGAGDFNVDGKADLIWQTNAGARYIWIMNNTALLKAIRLPNVAPAWSIRNF